MEEEKIETPNEETATNTVENTETSSEIKEETSETPVGEAAE